MISQDDFNAQGYFLNKNFLSQTECDYLLNLISEYRQQFSVPQVDRNLKPIPLSYFVIDGKKIQSNLPEIQKLYDTVNHQINQFTDQPLFPLKDIRVGCNVNIMEQGGTYRWHYDRNAVTAILYLNQVKGGEIEFYPNHRIILPNAKFSRFQRMLDRTLEWQMVRDTFNKKIVVKPQAGLLLIMRGDRCLHSVSPVLEASERINIVMAYDLPNASFVVQEQLNTYLYSSDKISGTDPNYSQINSGEKK